jgi:hypothetical protein
MAFAVDEKVTHPSQPGVEMTVVELKGDVVVVSFKIDEKRKMKEFPATELSKK